MNPLFTNLTQETLAYLEDQLSNNDVAGDDELIDLFIEELSLTCLLYTSRPGWRQAQRPVSHTPPRSHCHCAPCSHPRGRGGRGQITSRGQ